MHSLAPKEDVVFADAIDWWSTYGSETPEFAKITKKVFYSTNHEFFSWSGLDYLFKHS